MNTLDSIIQELKQEVNKDIQKEASIKTETNQEDISLEDLGLQISSSQKVSENLQKIASQIDGLNSIDEIVKVAEEIGNNDIAALVKIADTIGDRIADRVISRLSK